MVNIVLVSHSRKLAEGVKDLALQMCQNKVKIEAIGGIEEAGEISIGTDAQAIFEAMEALVDQGDVLVLMDIGSAVMSAEIALEMLPSGLQQNVCLCAAPLVEGAIVAAAQAMTGAHLDIVMGEATNALAGKISLLNPAKQAMQADEVEMDNYQLFDLLVPNPLGLHARPAVRLVEIVNRFEVNAMVGITANHFVSAKSITQIGTLGAKQGDILYFKISGREIEEFTATLEKFQKDNFGDVIAEKPLNSPSSLGVVKEDTRLNKGMIQGIAASNGLAVGKVKLVKRNLPAVVKTTVSDIEAEVEQLKLAVQQVIHRLKLTQRSLTADNSEEAQILDFHLLFLEDEHLIQKVINTVRKEKINVSYVWSENIAYIKKQYLQMDAPHLQERAGDITEIGDTVLAELVGEGTEPIRMDEPGVLVIKELGPAETINLDKSKVLGIVTAGGGDTSHSAILSRSLGIPAIAGIGNAFDSLVNGELVAIDGTKGEIWIGSENPEMLQSIRAQKLLDTQRKEKLLLKAQQPAITKNYRQISVLANVSSPEEAWQAYQSGAEGIGLYRTEFLYMNRDTPPDEEEQFEVYRAAAANMQGYPVTIRTLDVGGDKPIPYLNIKEEKNPFLGLRGTRYCLQDIDLFKTQLRAICRVSAEFPVRLMFPMISVPEEIMAVKEILQEVQIELTKAKIPHNEQIPVGVMVEVPSIIFLLPVLSQELDFLSIGTNDLTQYLLAADRENETVAKYRSAQHPGVLNALQYIIQNVDIEVGMCGELAGDPLMTNLLLAFGLKELSMNNSVIPRIKETIRNSDDEHQKSLLAKFRKLTLLTEVKTLLEENQPSLG